MFPASYFPASYFPASYWPKGGSEPEPPEPPIETACSGGQLPLAPESEDGNGCVEC